MKRKFEGEFNKEQKLSEISDAVIKDTTELISIYKKDSAKYEDLFQMGKRNGSIIIIYNGDKDPKDPNNYKWEEIDAKVEKWMDKEYFKKVSDPFDRTKPPNVIWKTMVVTTPIETVIEDWFKDEIQVKTCTGINDMVTKIFNLMKKYPHKNCSHKGIYYQAIKNTLCGEKNQFPIETWRLVFRECMKKYYKGTQDHCEFNRHISQDLELSIIKRLYSVRATIYKEIERRNSPNYTAILDLLQDV